MKSKPPRLDQVATDIGVVRPTRINPEPNPGGFRESPVHPLAATLLLVVDNLWNFGEWSVVSWVVTVPLGFLTVFFPTLVIQRYVKKDRFRRAFALALVLGAVAAIPTSITGTPVGLGLLAWSGLDKLIGRPLRWGGAAARADRGK
jgi:hypothetical protein